MKEITFPLTVFDGHLLFDYNGEIVLLDTGAPQSVYRKKKWLFDGVSYETLTTYHGLQVKELYNYIGHPVDLILGSDILSQYDFIIDTKKKSIKLDASPIDFPGIAFPLSYYLSIPVLSCRLNGLPVEAFLDTGAKLSYADPECVAGVKRSGEAWDFYPMLGRFKTHIYKISFETGPIIANMAFGILPDIIRFTFEMTRIKNIIGTEIFHTHSVCFSMKNNIVAFHPF